jgi:hypothetical protein
MSQTSTLYRPVGRAELDLIRNSGWRRFPPRLPEQPFFYPVIQREYAVKIARDWNVKASGSGYVTRFELPETYLNKIEVRSAGGRQHLEYWIAAEALEDFNDHIHGPIELIEEFGSDGAHWIWLKAYDLNEDRETIGLVQKATLTTTDFGLVPDVALFGSPEWWQAIKDGRIATHTEEGTISRVYWSGHGDWPQFEITAQGRKTQWTRAGNHSLYEEGMDAKVVYVMQLARKHWLGDQRQKEVLRIYLRRS